MIRNAVILGASAKPERYSHRALLRLVEQGFTVFPIHPAHKEINGVPVRAKLSEIESAVDILTIYLRPAISEGLADDIVALAPHRVIFNPGTESSLLQRRLNDAGIDWIEDCTLQMLNRGDL